MILINGKNVLTESDRQPQWNLLTNSKGPFQPNIGRLDNNQAYIDSKVYLVEGATYTLSAKSNGVFSNTHDSSHESNNCTIWVATPLNGDIDYSKPYRLISDSQTSKGTVFTWYQSSGTYVLRVNGYKKDGSTKAWDIKIERGTVATEWMPAIADLQLKSQNRGGKAPS